MSDYTIISAYGLTTRTWTLRQGEYGCAECCNQDRCDEDCDAKYYRPQCPHCKGFGWIPEGVVEQKAEAPDKEGPEASKEGST